MSEEKTPPGEADRWIEDLRGHRLNIHEALKAIEAEQEKTQQFQRTIAEEATAAQQKIKEMVAAAESEAVSAVERADEAAKALEAAEACRTKSEQELEEATRARQEATQAAETAKAQAEVAKTERDAAVTDAGFVKETRGQIEAAAADVKDARSRVEEHQRAAEKSHELSKSLADMATTIEAKIVAYEKALSDLLTTAKDRTDSQLLQIDRVLPQATSAGLSAAFEERRKAVKQDQKLWRGLFGGSLVGLLVLAVILTLDSASVPGLGAPGDFNWRAFAGIILRRGLLIAPVLWAALFASKQLKTQMLLEEEYAHKVAISNSFEGYKQQLADLPEAEGPVLKLIDVAIEALRRSPVRLYGVKQTSDAPIEEAASAGRQILEGAAESAAKITQAASQAAATLKKP